MLRLAALHCDGHSAVFIFGICMEAGVDDFELSIHALAYWHMKAGSDW